MHFGFSPFHFIRSKVMSFHAILFFSTLQFGAHDEQEKCRHQRERSQTGVQPAEHGEYTEFRYKHGGDS